MEKDKLYCVAVPWKAQLSHLTTIATKWGIDALLAGCGIEQQTRLRTHGTESSRIVLPKQMTRQA
eukprot:1155861-Pelagomonas_calceolata.AAC.4